MIAHEFEYQRPTTLMEATKYLADHPGTALFSFGWSHNVHRKLWWTMPDNPCQ